MTMASEKQMEKIGASRGCEDHDFDLVHELDKRRASCGAATSTSPMPRGTRSCNPSRAIQEDREEKC